MKKTFILAIMAAAITTVSCRKERTCDCKVTQTVVTTGYGAGTTTDYYSNKTTKEKQKKKDFKIAENCYSYTNTDTRSGGGNGSFAYTDVTTTEVKCELK